MLSIILSVYTQTMASWLPQNHKNSQLNSDNYMHDHNAIPVLANIVNNDTYWKLDLVSA